VARGAASSAREGTTLLEVARAARSGGALALAKTPEQLPVLAQAGVVDSGGTGLTLLYDALCYVLGGDELPEAPDADTITVHVHEEPHHGDGDVSELRYEVMFLLDADDAKMGAFRDVWAGIGDSIVVVGGEGLYNCHIHTDEIGAAIEAGIDVGRPYEIRVTDLAEQVVEEKWVREHVADQPLANLSPAPETAVVAVVAGDGVARIYRTLGVREIVTGGQSMNPSTADLVRAVERTGSSNVVILPNNKNIHAVAREVGNLTSVNVAVVPTTSIVEGFAALLSYDPAAALATNESGMTSAAAQVETGEITQAVRDTTTDAGEVHVGDWIGLSAEGIVAIADSIAVASAVLLERLVTPEHELVTILEGEGSSSANTRRITDFLAEEHPHVGVEVHHGGQPLYPYFFGVE
jgi:DAK2 domain fusion protein YloV